MRRQEGRAMMTTGTSDRRGRVMKGLAVGVGILAGSLVGWGEGWAQVPASRGMPAPSGSVQSGGQVTAPGLRSATPDQRRSFDRDDDRDGHRDHDRNWGWDRHYYYRPHPGYYSGYYPPYGYYYPPYGTYPGRWVWDGHNWLFVPLY